jgi:hypothetical protein
LAFADSARKGGGQAEASGVPDAKAWLQRITKFKAPNGSTATVSDTSRVLEPIFEPTFHPSSHGFRPKRGAQTAIAEAKRYIEQGRGIVVDLDLAKFFDTVNWQRLLARLAQRVKDKRVLRLIHRMLKAKVVMPDGTKVLVTEGTPQGGPLSPLLSNVVLDELDCEMERRGLCFVRYADDANIQHLRRRLRAIIVKHKKRSRHLYRHLRACGVEHGAAIRCAYRTRGVWPRSISNAMHRAYPNAWFEERVCTLWPEWQRQHPDPVVASDGQLLLGLEIAT